MMHKNPKLLLRLSKKKIYNINKKKKRNLLETLPKKFFFCQDSNSLILKLFVFLELETSD